MNIVTFAAAALVGAGMAFVAPSAEAMPRGTAPVDVTQTSDVQKVHGRHCNIRRGHRLTLSRARSADIAIAIATETVATDHRHAGGHHVNRWHRAGPAGDNGPGRQKLFSTFKPRHSNAGASSPRFFVPAEGLRRSTSPR